MFIVKNIKPLITQTSDMLYPYTFHIIMNSDSSSFLNLLNCICDFCDQLLILSFSFGFRFLNILTPSPLSRSGYILFRLSLQAIFNLTLNSLLGFRASFGVNSCSGMFHLVIICQQYLVNIISPLNITFALLSRQPQLFCITCP